MAKAIGSEMRNRNLTRDYLERAGHRVAAIIVLHQRESWADVVRESQEAVELALKALLRHINIEPPRVHDVSDILLENQDRLPETIRRHATRFAAVSHALRRDRELAFYGTEDLTPSDFYKKADADEALSQVQWVVGTLQMELSGGEAGSKSE